MRVNQKRFFIILIFTAAIIAAILLLIYSKQNVPFSPADSYRVFATNQTFDGKLGGVEGADAKCQESANTAGLIGSWKAYIGKTGAVPESRIFQSSLPYKRLDGALIANNWNDLTDGGIAVQIDIDEYGQKVTAEQYSTFLFAWTGDTDSDGKISACRDWTANNLVYSNGKWILPALWKEYGGAGIINWKDTNRNNAQWYHGASSGCHVKNRLYCVEQPMCGDGMCDVGAGEDCSSCESDCGACAPVCGDEICSGNLDEDCDGLIDCADTDCSEESICIAPSFPEDYVSYWRFQTETDGITPDETGANPGTFHGNAAIIYDAEKGKVLSLDGDDDYVDFGDPNIGTGGTELSVCAWIKVPTNEISSIQTIIGQSGDGNDPFSFFIDANEDIAFNVNNNAHLDFVGKFQDGILNKASIWRFVCGVLDGTNVMVYLNARKSATVVPWGGGVIDDSSQPYVHLAIGSVTDDANPPSTEFSGAIDDVIIYNRALSVEEIQAIYNTQNPGILLDCSEQEGVICSVLESCPGNHLLASDTTECCDSACVEIPDTCNECGVDPLNPCDIEECQSIAGCHYTLFNGCKSCKGTTCIASYGIDEAACDANVCGIAGGCSWQIDSGSCIMGSPEPECFTDDDCNSGSWCGGGKCLTDYCESEHGCVYYVDNDGGDGLQSGCSDSNDGRTLNTPFCTIQKAADMTGPGDTVMVRGGTYIVECPKKLCEILHIIRPGTSEKPITYTNYNYPNEKVILQGHGFEDRDLNGDGKADGIALTLPDQEKLIWIQANHIHIKGFELKESSAGGIVISGSFNLIEECIVHDNWLTAVGIGYSTSETTIVESNIVRNTETYGNRHGYGITIGRNSPGSKDSYLNYVRNNKIENCLSYNNGYESGGFNNVLPIGGDGDGGGNSDGMGASKLCSYYHTLNGVTWDDFNWCPNNSIISNIIFGNADDGMDVSFSDSLLSRNIMFSNGPDGGVGIKVFAPAENLFFDSNVAFDNHIGYEFRQDLGRTPFTLYHNLDLRNVKPTLIIPPNSANINNKWGGGEGLVNPSFAFEGDFYVSRLLRNQDSCFCRAGILFVPCTCPDSYSLNFPELYTVEMKIAYMMDKFRAAFSPASDSLLIDEGMFVQGHHCSAAGERSEEDCREWYGSYPDTGAFEFSTPISSPLSLWQIILEWFK